MKTLNRLTFFLLLCISLGCKNDDDTNLSNTINAADDDFSMSPVNSNAGGTLTGILDNDTLNGNAVSIDNVTITSTPVAPLTVNNDGTVTVDANTDQGTYTITYTICENDDTGNCDTATVTVFVEVNTAVNFQFKSTINVGGEGSSEISAFDPSTNQLYVVNADADVVEVYDISDVDNPVQGTAIDVSGFGAPNSVAVYNGKLAIAVEAAVKQNPGKISLYTTADNTLISDYTVGALPDMVTFSKDGSLIISANEGEPSDDYAVDPNGTVSIIEVSSGTVTTLDFTSFNAMESTLEDQGFRVFGPGADLAADVEPEYVTVSSDSQYAWVSLQENNGIAKINLTAKAIEDIYPLGFKDYNLAGNEIDASNEDGATELKNWPVYGMYQPDAITAVNIGGTEYIFSANEGDARDYDGFSEEERGEDLTLDPTVFPDAANLQLEENLGRIKVTTTLGDTDDDGDYDKIYNYGARSFSVWSAEGSLLYDSGNEIASRVLSEAPERFNWDWEDDLADDRSDDKGAEPEAVEVLNIGDQRYILFVGLERNSQVLVYDVTNPTAPQFLQLLQRPTDFAPEGLMVIKAEDSPTGNALLVVTNEDSGTVTFYENEL